MVDAESRQPVARLQAAGTAADDDDVVRARREGPVVYCCPWPAVWRRRASD